MKRQVSEVLPPVQDLLEEVCWMCQGDILKKIMLHLFILFYFKNSLFSLLAEAVEYADSISAEG